MTRERIKRVIIDLITASLSWLSFFYYRKAEIEHSEFILSSTLLYGTIGVTFFWVGLYIISGVYIEVRRVSRLNELFITTIHSIIGCLIIFFCLIIDDIENYKKFLTSAEALKTEKLNQKSGYLDVYQHITINLPFFNDRDYFFRMIANKEALYNNKLIEWYLLDQKIIERKDLEKKDLEATYLDYGAGLWLSNPSSENMFDICGRSE